MVIGIDVSQSVYGTGVSDYTINLYRSLQKIISPHHLTPVGFSLRRRQQLKNLFPDSRIYPIPPFVLEQMWNVFHIIGFENFSKAIDIYHSSDWTQAPSRAKKVTTVHDLAPIIYPDEHDPQIVSVHTRRLSRVVAECDAVICVSHNTAKDFLKAYHYPNNQVFVTHEALPQRFIQAIEKNSEGDYILAIGARQPRKNIRRLVSAHRKYQKKYHLPRLIIVGEGGIGYVSDRKLANLMAHARCFVYPSLYEGFGLPILGAFYHRTPVTCSDIPVFHEVAGDAAIYFDPHDEESIAKAISRAIQVPKSNANHQLNKFSWTKTAQETYKVYQTLCS